MWRANRISQHAARDGQGDLLMRSFRWLASVHCSRQQLIAMLLLVNVIAALLPVPIVSFLPTQGKDRSRPFPCQDRPCGCRSAEQCRKKCCCFSAEQKLAWAKQHGVSPSDVVPTAGTCNVEVKPASTTCCSSSRESDSRPPIGQRKSKHAANSTNRVQIVIGAMAQECQGAGQAAFGQFVYLIPMPVTMEPLATDAGERLVLEKTRFTQRFAEPPIPPPRMNTA